MKKISLSLSIALFLSVALFTSCKKDDPVNPGDDHSALNVEGHKTFLNEASANTVAYMEDLKESTSGDAINNVMSLFDKNDPFSEPTVKNTLKGIQTFIDNPNKETLLKSIQEGETRLPYADMVGEYTWNATTQTWDKTESSQIIINFPSTEGGTVNNAVLTFASYTDQQFTIDAEVVYLPTGASLNLVVDEVKQLELTFSASYNANAVPTSVHVALFINPFDFTLTLTNTNTVISEDFQWSKENENIIAFGSALNGDFSTLSFEEGEDPEETITTATAYVQMFDARLEGTANVEQLGQYEEPTLEQVNANTTIILKWANDKVQIATGEFYDKGEDDISVMLTFADQTQVDAEVYFESMMNQFETFFDNLESEYAK